MTKQLIGTENGDVIKPFAIKTIEAGGPKTILVK